MKGNVEKLCTRGAVRAPTRSNYESSGLFSHLPNIVVPERKLRNLGLSPEVSRPLRSDQNDMPKLFRMMG